MRKGVLVAAAVLCAAVLAVSLAPAGVDARACTDYKNCTTCTKVLSCGWCSATASCVDGDTQGPSTGKCLGAAWHHGVNNCTVCQNVKNCRECVDWAADCYWCGTSGSTQPPYGHCRDLGSPAFGCSATTECDCSHYAECGDCMMDAHCNWCTASESCVNPNTQPCSSPKIHTCPCGNYAECSSCSADDNCNWCADSSKPEKGVCEQAGQCGAKLIPQSCDAFCTTQGSDCTACNSIPGCAWCSKGLCKDSNFKATEECGMYSHTCPINCGSSTDCEACHGLGGNCQWCDSSESCLDNSKDVCELWQHSCANGGGNQTECPTFSGGSFVGGMFTVIGVLVLGAGGYFFYRWKMGQRVKYTELGG